MVAALLSALAPPKHLWQELGGVLEDAAVPFCRTFLPLSSTWTAAATTIGAAGLAHGLRQGMSTISATLGGLNHFTAGEEDASGAFVPGMVGTPSQPSWP